jgi:hypothetical protein
MIAVIGAINRLLLDQSQAWTKAFKKDTEIFGTRIKELSDLKKIPPSCAVIWLTHYKGVYLF